MNVAPRLTHTINYALQASLGTHGDPTFGAPQSIRARVEHKQQLVIGANQQEVMSDTWMVTRVEIPLTARVWLPGASTSDPSQARKPITTRKADTFGGYELFETYF